MDDFGNKNINCDYGLWLQTYYYIYNYMILIFGGALGVFVRHLYIKKITIMQKMAEYIAGSICAVYGANLLADILQYCLLYQNILIDEKKLLSFSSFLCGAFGLSLCEYGFIWLQGLKNKSRSTDIDEKS